MTALGLQSAPRRNPCATAGTPRRLPNAYLITGCGGFFMRAFVRLLGNDTLRTHHVCPTRLHPTRPVLEYLAARGKASTAIVGDTCDAYFSVGPFVDRQIDAIIHAAAVTHDPVRERTRPVDYSEANLTGIAPLLDAVWESGVAISSCAVYGPGAHERNPMPESSETVSDDTYGASRLTADESVRRYGELFEIPTSS